MTYIKDGAEYLDADEFRVYRAVVTLNGQGRTTNNSQVAAEAGLSRAAAGALAARMERRGFIRDAGKGAAYHWRLTGKHGQREPAASGCDLGDGHPSWACGNPDHKAPRAAGPSGRLMTRQNYEPVHASHVVVDTRDGAVFWQGRDGKLFDSAAAEAFALEKNQALKPEYQSYAVFRLTARACMSCGAPQGVPHGEQCVTRTGTLPARPGE
jgi:hypothetical protein